MNKLRYVGLIIGTVVGLVFAFSSKGGTDLQDVQAGLYHLLPIPFGMIGYGLGALLGTDRAIR
jgi:hypothetical protein